MENRTKNKSYLDTKLTLSSLKDRSRNVIISWCVVCNRDGNIKFLDTMTTVLEYIDLLHHKLLSRASKLGPEKTLLPAGNGPNTILVSQIHH